MRKFIDIISESFGSSTLSRNTDANEVIEFKVFCTKKEDVDSIKAVISYFNAVDFEVRAPRKKFEKFTFLCKGPRKDAEAIQRRVKMARVDGGVTRID